MKKICAYAGGKLFESATGFFWEGPEPIELDDLGIGEVSEHLSNGFVRRPVTKLAAFSIHMESLETKIASLQDEKKAEIQRLLDNPDTAIMRRAWLRPAIAVFREKIPTLLLEAAAEKSDPRVKLLEALLEILRDFGRTWTFEGKILGEERVESIRDCDGESWAIFRMPFFPDDEMTFYENTVPRIFYAADSENPGKIWAYSPEEEKWPPRKYVKAILEKFIAEICSEADVRKLCSEIELSV